MTLSANQPYFLPYLPYWQLIDCADTFLISDDYAYMKQSWIPRNRILVGGRPQYFRLEVKGKSCHRLIGETELVPIDAAAKLRTLAMAYHKAPFFNSGYELVERIFACPSNNLCTFITASIREVCDYLGITTRIEFTSSVPGNSLLPRNERIYHFCRHFGATRYVNAIGGQGLYRFDEFRKRGIELNFIQSEIPPYRQLSSVFVPRLSVIDAIMNVSRDELREMMDKRSFIHE